MIFLSCTTVLWGRNYHPHFTEEHAEPQEGSGPAGRAPYDSEGQSPTSIQTSWIRGHPKHEQTPPHSHRPRGARRSPPARPGSGLPPLPAAPPAPQFWAGQRFFLIARLEASRLWLPGEQRSQAPGSFGPAAPFPCRVGSSRGRKDPLLFGGQWVTVRASAVRF